MPIPDNIRQELARLCSRKGTRDSVFSRDRPTHWNPSEAYDPNTGEPYTEDGAWEKVAAELQNGCEVWPKELDKPPGKIGYVLYFKDAKGKTIYVKLQIANKVIGRSFHEEKKNG